MSLTELGLGPLMFFPGPLFPSLEGGVAARSEVGEGETVLGNGHV